MDLGSIALVGTGLGLGLRHGIDWDHIAAITDITSTTTADEGVAVAGNVRAGTSGVNAIAARPTLAIDIDSWRRFFLATLYALGHASVVVALGLLAIWFSTLLPDWIDPIMERVVGVTLIALGVYIIYQLWQYGREYQLRSRWMLVFALVGRGWARVKSRMTGIEHQHRELSQYGKGTAFGIGMIHGIGAETGSQALLLAGAAGSTTRASGSLMLLAFTVGLLISNSTIAVLATFGFVSSETRKNIYLVIGIIAAAFSLTIGFLFLLGQGAALPNIQAWLGAQ